MTITVTEITPRRNGLTQTWEVKDGRIHLGIVTKFKDTETETYPYQAKAPGPRLARRPLVGSFYPEDYGGDAEAKAAAVDALRRR